MYHIQLHSLLTHHLWLVTLVAAGEWWELMLLMTRLRNTITLKLLWSAVMLMQFTFKTGNKFINSDFSYIKRQLCMIYSQPRTSCSFYAQHFQVVKNATGRAAATTEGLALAYASLFLMAVVPIFWGSFRSISYHRSSKVNTLFLIVLIDQLNWCRHRWFINYRPC